jgi:hypothetical protein
MTVEERIDRIEKLVLFFLEMAKNTGAFFALANDETKQHAESLQQDHGITENPPTTFTELAEREQAAKEQDNG